MLFLHDPSMTLVHNMTDIVTVALGGFVGYLRDFRQLLFDLDVEHSMGERDSETLQEYLEKFPDTVVADMMNNAVRRPRKTSSGTMFTLTTGISN